MTLSSVDRLEFEAESTRRHVSDLIDELRDRVSPGEVVDQVLEFAGKGAGGDFVRTLGRQVRENPLPCVLIGAGIAWLMTADHRANGTAARAAVPATGSSAQPLSDAALWEGEITEPPTNVGADAVSRTGPVITSAADRARSGVAGAAGRAGAVVSDAATAVSDTARGLSSGAQALAGAATGTVKGAAALATDTLRDTAGTVKQTAADAVDTVSATASELGHRAADAVRDTSRTARDVGRRTGATLTQLIQDQPLVLAGLGLAIGAAIGAALPATEAEDRLLGETSDEVKTRARAMAGEQVEKARGVAAQTYEAAKAGASQVAEEATHAAHDQGFPTGTLRAEHDRAEDATGEKPHGEARPRDGSGEGHEQDRLKTPGA